MSIGRPWTAMKLAKMRSVSIQKVVHPSGINLQLAAETCEFSQVRPLSMGLYRENAIAIESEARDPFGGSLYYVTMQITFPIPEFARKERNLHCDVVHVTTKWVSRLVLDHAIAAIQTSR